ncbi:MAG: hypothetical protein AB1568_04570 [Thermodesulfobacteriota bacterium]
MEVVEARQGEMFLEQLSAREEGRRQELETYVVENLRTFIQVGQALAEISRERLYRSTHLDFAGYCQDIFAMSRQRAYQLIDASQVAEHLSTNCRHLVEPPKNEGQIRPLLKYKDEPKKFEQVWVTAAKTAPNGKVTAKHVQATIFDITGEQVTKTITRQREEIRKDDQISKSFSIAFDAFLGAIEAAKAGKYQTTSREAILKRLDALRHLLAEDGKLYIKDSLAD